MKVIIPVAGSGTRLRPHTISVPKSLLHVGGKPVLVHILEPLIKLNPEEVIFVIGHKGEMIIDYVHRHYSFKCRFVPQEKLLGLGYAVHLGLQAVGDEPTLVILGDTIVECDCHDFLRAGEYVLGLKQVEDPTRFGIAEVHNGYITNLEEKPSRPKTNLALIGLYYFDKTNLLKQELAQIVSKGTTTNGEIQLTDALQAMIDKGVKFKPYEVSKWYDCGKKETLLATNRHILSHLPPPTPIDGSVLIPPVYVAPTAQVYRSIIGPDVSISDGAVIKDAVITNSIIGYHAHLENVLLENSLIGHHTNVKGVKKILNIGESTEIDQI